MLICWSKQTKKWRAQITSSGKQHYLDVNVAYRQLKGGNRLAYDVLDFDESIEKAVRHVCGSTVISPTLGDARELRFGSSSPRVNAKIVTLDGHVISKSGAMTGGASEADLAKAAVFDQAQVSKAQARIKQLEKEIVAVDKKLTKFTRRDEHHGGAGIGERRHAAGREPQILADLGVLVVQLQERLK